MWRYYAFRIVGFTLPYLPKQAGYLLGRLIADVVYLLCPSLKATIRDNVRHVLGRDVDRVALEQTVRGVLRTVARNYADLVRMRRTKLGDIESCVTINGWHNVEDALKRGKGIIFVTAHLGGFDLAAQILAVRSIKTTVLVEPLEPPSLLRHVTDLRSSKGLNFVPARPGIMEVLMGSLRSGEAVALACDRDIARHGLKSSFFGEETTLPADAVRIAMRTGAAVVPAFSLRREDGGYEAYFEAALDIIPGRNGAVARNMERVVQVMEKYVRRSPEQWVVLSPVWTNGR